MYFTEVVFWTCLFIIFYNYAGYTLVLATVVAIKKTFIRKVAAVKTIEPDVTLIIAAYNEADFIEKKILNCFELIYPENKLHFIFITDGSSDNTPQKISRHERVQLLHQPERKGKTAALNRAMQYVNTPIVVFCDANTLLNPLAIKNIARHYANPAVGGVSGEKKIITSFDTRAAGIGEGIYWKYESLLKKLDSAFYSVVGAAGELFSIRTALFDPVDPAVILDDFIISLSVAMKGYRIIYEPDAYAMETPSVSMEDEQKRKIRISAGGFQSMVMLKGLLNIFKFPLLSFQYISHRVLRWTLTPLSLPLLLLSNCILAAGSEKIIFKVLLICQLTFYFLALLGSYFSRKGLKVKSLYILYYFLFMNFSVYSGFLRFLNNAQPAAWEKASREKP